MVHSFLITLTVLLGQAGPKAVEPDKDDRARIKDYYSSWVGVRAPEIGDHFRDRQNKPVSLSSFRGKRVLLFSFDSGGYSRKADEKAVLATLRALDKARQTVGRDKLAVVGFTEGALFFTGEVKPDDDLGRLSGFPILTVVRVYSKKDNEPYNLLRKPGAVLIDSQGVLRAFYDHALSERELLDAMALGDWDKPVRPEPVEDPWLGKEPPKATHQDAIAWSRPLPKVVGMTGGDWDLRGSDDLIVATADELIVIDPADGKERHKFPLRDIDPENRFSLGWARFGKEKSGVFLFSGGWPTEVAVIGGDGAPLWAVKNIPGAIHCLAWADLDGAGSKTLIVGLAGGGLHALDEGKPRWKHAPAGWTWAVAGIDGSGERPGRVISSGEGKNLSVLDARGGAVGKIATEGHIVTILAASEMNGAGDRQVVAIWETDIGIFDHAVATDLQGKVLWKFPVNVEAIRWMASPMIAGDVTGDGTKEWIIVGEWGELVVLDTRGRLVAAIEATGNVWGPWTVIERKGKPGWIITEEAGKVSAFTLSLKK